MHALGFGIGLHHAGLLEKDRQLVEELFVNGKIQILVATSTLAWGVNYPAHLVIIKGTEYFDAKKKGYVDYPITDVLQMMGRAGRIQFSDSGVAQIFVQDTKKDFYKKFLYESFPVESHLHKCLHDHLNAEIVTGSVKNKQDAVDYLTWTYFYRRLLMVRFLCCMCDVSNTNFVPKQNPAYYAAEDANPVNINLFLSQLIEDTLQDLTAAFCVEMEGDFDIIPTGYSNIASYYYLNYRTIQVFKEGLSKPARLAGNLEDGQAKSMSLASLLRVLSDAHEYDELPVRHNEDLMNKALEKSLPLTLAESAQMSGSKHTEHDDPHCKAFLLLQAHLDRLEPLPCSDYVTDTNSVLDQSIRILQAMVDFCVLRKSLSTSLGVMNLMQCIKQARWSTDSSLLCLPHVTQDMVASIRYQGSPISSLSQLAGVSKSLVESVFSQVPQLRRRDRDEIIRVVQGLPVSEMTVSLSGVSKKDGIWKLEGSQKYDSRTVS